MLTGLLLAGCATPPGHYFTCGFGPLPAGRFAPAPPPSLAAPVLSPPADLAPLGGATIRLELPLLSLLGYPGATEPFEPAPAPDFAAPASLGTAADPGRLPGHHYRPLFARLAAGERRVALTIDDGPGPYTDLLLQQLAAAGVHATFFLVGDQPTVLAAARRIEAAGHLVALHTLTHPKLSRLSGAGQAAELAPQEAAFARVLGAAPAFMRPPYGAYNRATLAAAGELGLATVLWDVDSRDWALRRHPERILANVRRQVRPGSIILIHERRQTVQVLPRLLAELQAAGYRLVRLDGRP